MVAVRGEGLQSLKFNINRYLINYSRHSEKGMQKLHDSINKWRGFIIMYLNISESTWKRGRLFFIVSKVIH